MVDGGGVVVVSSVRVSCFVVVIVIWLALDFGKMAGIMAASFTKDSNLES